MASGSTLWRTADGRRSFLIPDGLVFDPGSLSITDFLGRGEHVDPRCVEAFEMNADQAQRWAKDQLGEVLDDLRGRIDDKLSDFRKRLARSKHGEISLRTAPALLDFVRTLPGVICKSLSGDEQRIGAARQTMAGLQQRLKDSGIDVDNRMKDFADRLASIRAEAQAGKATAQAADEDKPA